MPSIAIRASIVAWAVACVACSHSFSSTLMTNNRFHRRSSLRMVGGGDNPLDGAGELTSTLARLDRQWKIQQRAKGGKSRWTKLVLPRESEASAEPVVETSPFDAVGQTADVSPEQQQQQQEDFVYLLEPESSFPSCLIVFVGGAGLGSFPQIAYNELLMRISSRLNAAILAAPYQVGLDHFALAKQTGERLRRAMLHCEDDPGRQYSTKLPTYCLAHSLGAKLQTIYMAATGQDYDGIGFLSFNNFGFAQTIGMAKEFATQLRNADSSGFGGTFQDSDVLNGIFDLAETALGALGVDFTPRPADLERIVELRYDPERQSKTRLFVFDDDTLDSSQSFLECCGGTPGPSVSKLKGNHLTPVFFRFGLEDLPEEARVMATDALGGFENASFGNEEELSALVDEVCDWILGKGPSCGPFEPKQEPRRLSGQAGETTTTT